MPWAPPTHQKTIKQQRRGGLEPTCGYGAGWHQLRLRVLARDPWCKLCEKEGRVAVSTDADHIVPRSEGGSDKMSNLQGACHSCHSRKTATLDGGFGN